LWRIAAQFGFELVLAVLLGAVFFFLINYVLPLVFDAASLARNRELPILLAITVCLTASWAANRLQLSPALGAFVAGVLLAESPYAVGIRADVSVFRTVFVTMFFASIGMLADLEWARANWQLLTMAVPAVLVGKAAVIWLVGRLFRLPRRHAIASGLCLSQIGEFSFLLASEAGGVLPEDGFRLVVSTAVVTLLFTPYLVSVGPRIGLWAVQHLPGGDDAAGTDDDAAGRSLKDHVIIIGFGPAGQAVLDAVRSAQIQPVVLDLNPRTIAAAQADGIYARIGDASQSTVMNELHPESARAVVVTIPDHRTAVQIVHQVRLRAPQTPVFARARYHVYASELEREGATIVNEESYTGYRLGVAVLQELGLRVGVDPHAGE
jgi:CPA2 family monovalent cation:H+ antiporter-2